MAGRRMASRTEWACPPWQAWRTVAASKKSVAECRRRRQPTTGNDAQYPPLARCRGTLSPSRCIPARETAREGPAARPAFTRHSAGPRGFAPAPGSMGRRHRSDGSVSTRSAPGVQRTIAPRRGLRSRHSTTGSAPGAGRRSATGQHVDRTSPRPTKSSTARQSLFPSRATRPASGSRRRVSGRSI